MSVKKTNTKLYGLFVFKMLNNSNKSLIVKNMLTLTFYQSTLGLSNRIKEQ
jgi:hypothetical protein